MQLSDAFSIEQDYEFEGKIYQAKAMTLEQLAKFSTWLKNRAKSEAMRPLEDAPQEYALSFQKMALETVFQDIAAGVYDVGGQVFIKAFTTVEGWIQAVYISLNDQGVTREMAAKMVRDKLDQKMTDLLVTVVGDGGKASSPVASPTGESASATSGTTTEEASTKSSE